MAKTPKRPRGRAQPALRHHLEDALDSRLRKRENHSHREHRHKQYLTLAQRHLVLVIGGDLTGPLWEGAELRQLVANADGSVLTLVIDLAGRGEDADSIFAEAIEALLRLLRLELAQHVPRRRTPSLRILIKAS